MKKMKTKKKVSPLRWLKYKYFTFMRIEDHPQKIAIGAALGISFDVLPTFGTGVIIAYLLATYLKVNRLATVIGAVVFKLAIPFFTLINLKTGQIFIKDSLADTTKAVQSSWLHHDWSVIGTTFLLGSVINAVLVYGITYLSIERFITWRRAKKKRNG